MSPEGGTIRYHQEVRVENGFGYGVIGADLHVHGNGSPLYLLYQHQPPAAPDVAALLAQPSKLLDARHAIVGFTGRRREMAAMAAWRDDRGHRLAARWLHGPGGQGKTRLLAELAHECQRLGWKVAVAVKGLDAVHKPGTSQDLRIDRAAGLLLLVDYADRWPSGYLTWLFSNGLLHQRVPTRVLLAARGFSTWPAVRGEVAKHGAHVDDHPLSPLSTDRKRTFAAARDSFAACYGLSDATAIGPPAALENPEFGLTLTLHMAALVAVDAASRRLTPPADPAGLSTYLLDRERRHWETLYESGRRDGLPFTTRPKLMEQAVFAATLAGPVSSEDGLEILGRLGADGHRTVVEDHGCCYPPVDAATVLEPLYPDRLGEDFVALATPGHSAAGQSRGEDWAIGAPARLVAPAEPEPPYAGRIVTVLVETGLRWPHVTRKQLEPLLRRWPRLAIAAGGATLARLAEIEPIDPEVLEAVASELPPRSQPELDVGSALVARRVARRRLEATDDAGERLAIHLDVAKRMTAAGLHDEALVSINEIGDILQAIVEADRDMVDPLAPLIAQMTSMRAASLAAVGRLAEALRSATGTMDIMRTLAESDPASHEPSLASTATMLAVIQARSGRPEEALVTGQEAVAVLRRLTRADAPSYEALLAEALNNLGIHLKNAGCLEEALPVAREAVDIFRRVVERDPVARGGLADSLSTLGNRLADLDRPKEAAAATGEAVEHLRHLARANGTGFDPALARTLSDLSSRLAAHGRLDDALAVELEATAIKRRLASTHPAAHEDALANSLHNLAIRYGAVGRTQEAVDAAGEAVDILESLAEANPDAFRPRLSHSLSHLGIWGARSGQHEEALIATVRAVEIDRELVKANPAVFEPNLAGSLNNLSHRLVNVGRHEAALAAAEESVALYRRCVERHPQAFGKNLSNALDTLTEVRGLISDSLPPN